MPSAEASAPGPFVALQQHGAQGVHDLHVGPIAKVAFSQSFCRSLNMGFNTGTGWNLFQAEGRTVDAAVFERREAVDGDLDVHLARHAVAAHGAAVHLQAATIPNMNLRHIASAQPGAAAAGEM